MESFLLAKKLIKCSIAKNAFFKQGPRSFSDQMEFCQLFCLYMYNLQWIKESNLITIHWGKLFAYWYCKSQTSYLLSSSSFVMCYFPHTPATVTTVF